MSATGPKQLRRTKRDQIVDFFSDALGVRFFSSQLHARFGSAFRSRVSEINRDPDALITIFNSTTFEAGTEHSAYWAEPRTSVGETIPMSFPETEHKTV